MSNNAPDYENNLAFDPDINTMPRCDIEELKKAIEKLEKENCQLNIVLNILLRECPQYEGYVRANFPHYFEELNK